MQAIDFIEDDKNILILYGDTPLITKRKFRGIAIIPRKKENNNVSIVSTVLENPAGYGHIIRDEKR